MKSMYLTSPTRGSRPLALMLDGMSFEDFLDMQQKVFVSLLYLLQQTKLLHSVILSIIGVEEPADVTFVKATPRSSEYGPSAAASSPRSSMSSMPEQHQRHRSSTLKGVDEEKSMYDEVVSESSELVNSVADSCYMRCSKLIASRSELNSRLTPAEFYRLFGATWEFVGGGEGINSGHACVGLKSTILSQAKSFLSYFHDEKTRQLAMLVENEQWTQAKVPLGFQQIVSIIVESAETPVNIEQLSISARVSQEFVEGGNIVPLEQGGDLSSPAIGDPGFPKVSSRTNSDKDLYSEKFLIVDGQQFYTVGCLLLFLKMLTEYLRCMDGIPGLTTDCLNRILDILKV